MSSVRHIGAFPFCPQPYSSTGDDSERWPAPIDLPVAMEWYWRVKKWKIVAEYTYDDGGGTTQSGTHEGYITVPEADERDLVCERTAGLSYEYSGGDFEYIAVNFLTPVSAGYEVTTDGSLFRPQFDASLYGTADRGILSTISATGLSSGGAVTLDGIDVDSYVSIYTTSASIVVTPEEYWPYDPGDGDGPIYDTGTGEQLRDMPI